MTQKDINTSLKILKGILDGNDRISKAALYGSLALLIGGGVTVAFRFVRGTPEQPAISATFNDLPGNTAVAKAAALCGSPESRGNSAIGIFCHSFNVAREEHIQRLDACKRVTGRIRDMGETARAAEEAGCKVRAQQNHEAAVRSLFQTEFKI